MTETPREYKQRIDEKWKKNEENKERLIKKIEGYEILDERFKAKTKQEILANFDKNERAELEGEQYTTIVAELGKIDEKYEELEDLKRELKAKKIEKSEIEKEITGSKLDGADETTLDLQIINLRKLDDKLKKIESEIGELDNKIKNREQEIKEIEESYGKMTENNEKYSETENKKDKESETHEGQRRYKPETLKEVHEETIKKLWEKDKKRNEIIRILDEGVGIDNDLKERIKREIFEKFFEYYDEKQGNLKVKSARYIKNKLKHTEKTNTEEINELETIYGVGVLGKDRIREIIGTTIKIVKPIHKIGGENVYEIEDENGKYYIIHGENLCGEGYDTIRNVRDIGGELLFLAKRDGKSYLIRGDTIYEDVNNIQREGGEPKFFTRIVDGEVWLMHGKKLCGKGFDKNCKIKEIKEIGGKIVYQVKNSAGFWEVYRGNTSNGEGYEKINEIKEVGGELVFTAERAGITYLSRGNTVYGDVNNMHWEGLEKPIYTCESGGETWFMHGTEKLVGFSKIYGVGEIKEIGGEAVFVVKKDSSFWYVYRKNERCGNWYEEIGSIKDVGGKPAFWGRRFSGLVELVRGLSEIRDNIKGANDPIDIGGKPVYKIVYPLGYYEIYRGRERCGNIYDEILGEIKEVEGKPSFTGIRGGVKHEVLGTEEI